MIATLMDYGGHDRDIRWLDKLMDAQSKCKELEWLEEGSHIDSPGVDISMGRGYVSMSTHSQGRQEFSGCAGALDLSTLSAMLKFSG